MLKAFEQTKNPKELKNWTKNEKIIVVKNAFGFFLKKYNWSWKSTILTRNGEPSFSTPTQNVNTFLLKIRSAAQK
jgi:hypothetical protein